MDVVQAGLAVARMFLEILVGGITTVATGIAEGVNTYVMGLFFVTAEGVITGLSPFGIILAIFASIALALGLTSLLFQFIKSLGN